MQLKATKLAAIAFAAIAPFVSLAADSLPSDYTRLDWIKSTRAQRIKTDYVPNAKTWMEVDFKLDGGWDASTDQTSYFFRSNGATAGYSGHIGSDGAQYNRFLIYVNPTFHVRLVGELFSPRNAA